MKHLSLPQFHCLDGDGKRKIIKAIVSFCTNLQSLYMNDFLITGECLENLKPIIGNIQRFSFKFYDTVDDVVLSNVFSQNTKLEELSISYENEFKVQINGTFLYALPYESVEYLTLCDSSGTCSLETICCVSI